MWPFNKRYTEAQMEKAVSDVVDEMLEKRFGERDWETGNIYGDDFLQLGNSRNPRLPLTYPATAQALQLISGDIATKPLVLTKDNPMKVDDPEPWHDSQVNYLICKQPRPHVTAFQFWRRIMLNCLVGNSGYAMIIREGDKPVELWELPYWWVYWNTVTEHYEVTVNGPGGIIQERFDVPQHNMIHIEGLCYSDYWRELCVTFYNLGPSWGVGKAAEDFIRVFFERGAQASGVITVPAAMKKAAREKIEEGIIKKYGGLNNAFKIMVLRDGAKFESTQVAPVDAEVSKIRQDQVADVARSFNLPPHKLGLPMNVSYSSLLEEEKAYTRSTLGPWLVEIQTEVWNKLLTERQKRSVTEPVYVTHLRRTFVPEEAAPAAMQQPRPSRTEPETDDSDSETPESTNGNDQRLRRGILQPNGRN